MFLFVYLLFSNANPITANWWLLAMPSANQLISQLSPRNYKEQCWQMPREVLPQPRQRELCTLSENMLVVVSQGARMALFECQNQFSSRRWNCSTSPRYQGHIQLLDQPINNKSRPVFKSKGTGRMLADVPIVKDKKSKIQKKVQKPPSDLGDLFGGVLAFDSREKAYVHAISAAGVSFSITRGCKDGRLPSCKCDPNVNKRQKAKKKGKPKKWTWGGCSDHVRYGERISKDFVDSSEMVRWRKAERRLMNLHNNEAGRRAVRKNLKRSCKCHGISGSCSLKVCWRQLRTFKEIGDYLHKKFDGATRVVYRQKRHRLTPSGMGIKRPTKKDLVYLQESPDYCHPNPKYGITGTTGRRCNRSSFGVDGCSLMCCGRGYETAIVKKVEDCNCRFEWCCKVVCSKCSKTEFVSYCK